MENLVLDFLKRHSSIIITTHDIADADGIGAELVFIQIARHCGIEARIINASAVPDNFQFMDPDQIIEQWDKAQDNLPKKAAMVVMDSSDEYHIGKLRDYIDEASEVFVIDHHESNPLAKLKGYMDSSASSTCEIVLEFAFAMGIKLTPSTAKAAYTGIVYDTGFFAYSKTSSRTFKAALTLVETGVNPYEVYRDLNENASIGALLLQKTVISTLEIHNQGKVAVQILRKEDLEQCHASYEDAENFINLPLKCREIEVSLLIKENREGQTRCSLRSKGAINVSKIAQTLGGGGHVAAAGFKSPYGPDETLGIILEKLSKELNKHD
ncbi:MAG: bifunctional oligoribonuclease/PAP phosphatase NrnA [Treponema sp.]|nr:bifunctional oligoribonuclease/PAP phosphatase NrnA [Treponema sp.]